MHQRKRGIGKIASYFRRFGFDTQRISLLRTLVTTQEKGQAKDAIIEFKTCRKTNWEKDKIHSKGQRMWVCEPRIEDPKKI